MRRVKRLSDLTMNLGSGRSAAGFLSGFPGSSLLRQNYAPHLE